MGMTITFFKTDSDNRKLSKELTNVETKEINIREDCNVHDFDIIVTNNIDCNYAYIETFNRYYFVNTTKISQNQTRLHFKCDVLMSFANEILELEPILTRSTNSFNGYLPDSEFQAYSYEEIVCKEFPNAMNNDSIILMTIG